MEGQAAGRSGQVTCQGRCSVRGETINASGSPPLPLSRWDRAAARWHAGHVPTDRHCGVDSAAAAAAEEESDWRTGPCVLPNHISSPILTHSLSVIYMHLDCKFLHSPIAYQFFA